MGRVKTADDLYGKDSGLSMEKGSGTDSSQAITLQARAGRVTSSTTNLAAATTEDITLTCKYLKATSIVLTMVSGGGAGDIVMSKVTPAAGSVVFTALNADQANACDAAYIIDYVIINPV